MRMSFDATKDHLYGSFETLTENRKAAVELVEARAQQAAL